MINAIVNYHKRRITHHAVIVPMMFMCTMCFMARYDSVYSAGHWFTCLRDICIAYVMAFYAVPVLFQVVRIFLSCITVHATDDDMCPVSAGHRDYKQASSPASLCRISMADRYDHNRNSASSSLHRSSLGKRFC